MLSKVRIGMVGAGAVAARHVRTLLAMDGVEVAAVADPALERAGELAAEAGAAAYPNHMELLEAERLDAVYICVPPFAHGAPELAVIDAGLPMFVEKPVAIDQETARPSPPAWPSGPCSPAPATTGAGWTSSTGRPACWPTGRPASSSAPGWTRSPAALVARRDGSGGQTIEQTTHVLDTARALAGNVTEVHAYVEAALPAADISAVSVATLRFASGAVGTVASTCLLPRLHRAGVHIVADGLSLELTETELVVENGRREAWTADADARPRPDRDFIAAVRGRGPDPGAVAGGLPDPPGGLRHHPVGGRGPPATSGGRRWLTGGRCGCW